MAWSRVEVRVPNRVVGLFVRHLATMLRGGVNLTVALDALTEQKEYPEFGAVIGAVAEDVHSGLSLSESWKKFPGVFPKTLVGLAQVGEQTGQITDVLDEAGSWLDKDEAVRRDVQSALAYPILVLSVTSIVTLGLFWSVMPQFTRVLTDLGVELPLVTRITIWLTESIRNPGPWVVGLGLVLWLKVQLPEWMATPTVGRIMVNVPALGAMLVSAYQVRFCSTLAMLTFYGVDLVRSVTLAAQATGSQVLIGDSARMAEAIKEGETLSTHMASNPLLYSAMTVAFIRAGEETGQLSTAISHAARIQSEELTLKLSAFSALLVPVLICFVAALVAMLLFSVFIPVYSVLGKF